MSETTGPTRRAVLAAAVAAASGGAAMARQVAAVIDALDRPAPLASNGAAWALVSDRVMGGRSAGAMTRETVRGRPATRMTGRVSLENDGGFLQIALDLAPDGGAVDASGWAGLEIDVAGDGERYGLHLRTTDIARPWQSYRAGFEAPADWTTVRLPFAGFASHRIKAPLDPSRLRRLGVVAIGRAFAPDVAVGGLRFYA